MHFYGPIIRPPTDDFAYIEFTIGCTYTDCTFCNFYDGFPFRMAKWEDIEEDFKELSTVRSNTDKLWASGGNPIALHMKHLRRFAELNRKYLPKAKIYTYARVDDLCRKTVENFKELKELGYYEIIVGVESFDNEVLAHVKKGYTVADIRKGLSNLEAAGMRYRIIYLGGLAGKGKGVESALKSVEVINEFHPNKLMTAQVSLLRGTPLYDEMKRGEFTEENEHERLEEFYALFSHLKNPIEVFTQVALDKYPIHAFFPEDQDAVLRLVKNEINKMDDQREGKLLRIRRSLRSV